MCTHMHTYTNTCTHICTHACILLYTHTYTHTPIHTQTHTHSYTLTWTHMHTLVRCLNIRDIFIKYEMWKEQFLDSLLSLTDSVSGERGCMRHKDGDRQCTNCEVTKSWGPGVGVSADEWILIGKEFGQLVRGFTWPQPVLLGTKVQVSFFQIQSRSMLQSYFSPALCKWLPSWWSVGEPQDLSPQHRSGLPKDSFLPSSLPCGPSSLPYALPRAPATDLSTCVNSHHIVLTVCLRIGLWNPKKVAGTITQDKSKTEIQEAEAGREEKREKEGAFIGTSVWPSQLLSSFSRLLQCLGSAGEGFPVG